jgi:hypothetical protein
MLYLWYEHRKAWQLAVMLGRQMSRQSRALLVILLAVSAYMAMEIGVYTVDVAREWCGNDGVDPLLPAVYAYLWPLRLALGDAACTIR